MQPDVETSTILEKKHGETITRSSIHSVGNEYRVAVSGGMMTLTGSLKSSTSCLLSINRARFN